MNYQGDEVRRRILKSFHIFDQLLITIVKKMMELIYLGTVDNDSILYNLGHVKVGKLQSPLLCVIYCSMLFINIKLFLKRDNDVFYTERKWPIAIHII